MAWGETRMAGDALTRDEAAALEEIVFELTAPHTLEEIAHRIGYTVRGVQFIEQRALAKLRSLIAEEWAGSLDEPPSLSTRMWNVYPSDGMASKSRAERDGA